MKLKRVVIENYRAISHLELHLHEQMNVFFGGNARGKTSLLSAVAVGLGSILRLLPGVSSVGFRAMDRRRRRPTRVILEADDGTRWERRLGLPPLPGRLDGLRERLEPVVVAEELERDPRDLPIVAFYDTERSVADSPQRRGAPRVFPRFGALDGALSPQTRFHAFFSWFYGKEHEESSEQRRRRDPDYRLPELEAVRRAIESLVPGISAPMVAYRPLRFAVSVVEDDETQEFALDQLSGGYRVMLALAADLARRMAQGNPHLDEPLQSEAVVLIDEVDLHLHPSWQQRVLPDLMRTFPNAQFLISTHSPQVLTTVEADRIVHLERVDGEIGAYGAAASTYGARASDALEKVMGVDERPAGNGFVTDLRRYLRWVAQGKGESLSARALRKKLVEIAPEDPDLASAALEIRRQRVMRDLGRE